MPYHAIVDANPSGPTGRLAVRAMTTADVPAVIAIERAAYGHGWAPSTFERELTTNGMARYLVLEREGELVGFAGAWLMVDQAHVVTVAVLPDARRRGYGRLLLHELLALSQREGMTDATLEVRPSNAAARELYREYGFYEVGERKRYYGDGEDALVLTTEAFDSVAYRERHERLGALLASRFPGVRHVP